MTVCTGIMVGNEQKVGSSHKSQGHRFCPHLACSSCCQDLGSDPCQQHKKVSQGITKQLSKPIDSKDVIHWTHQYF
ncbi:hypothetical protein CROQUDRAFT_482562 [Cronartium quercuum f. sp. fusiforme G11]|uniref:Uncharacterized protein n=1 Tax=Cronartium quercuum f. sp. fusiforme G11 TaxID=708437 RepID=A0A9P6NHK3_9BASI|nr:hypothetical protein CROQUDRAFT_482562 [Cronartium quercuum f. sp. fusiforme G11]